MTVPALHVQPDASLADAARLLHASEASDLMVADADGHLVGVLSEGDLIRAVLPDIDEILGAGGSVRDAMDVFERKGRRLAGQSITPDMITEPLTVTTTDHVAVAAAALIQRQIRRLPVIENGRLVGTVSRSDVARAVLDERRSS
jgi:CBS domain-containing protein